MDFHGTYPVPAEAAKVSRGEQAVLITVPDSSMATAGIGKGCMVLTHVNAKVNPGDICLSICDKTQPRIRYCKEANADRVVLTTADTEKPPEVFEAAERKNVHVIGPCIAIYQDLPRGKELT